MNDIDRFTVILRESGREDLNEGQRVTKLNAKETIHKALGILVFLLRETAAGRQVYTSDPDGKNPTRLMIL
jgi:hypothetical protein